MLTIQMEKEVTFDLPEGRFLGKVVGLKPFTKQSARGKQDWLRMLFEIMGVPGLENVECRAGRNFMLSFKQGSDLRNFLTPMLGTGFFKQNSAKSLDLESVVVGLVGEVTLSHFCGQDYDRPLIVVETFEPVKEGKD
jgi:hypothetical protein